MTQFDEFLSALDVAQSINSNGWAECMADDSIGFGAANQGYNLVETGLFLILFAQFEAEINIRCRTLIAQSKLLPDWRDRRPWESFDEKRVNDIPFKRRLALLVDKSQTIYAAIQTLYSERNEIAHGGRLDMVTDFENAYKTLKAALAAMEETP